MVDMYQPPPPPCLSWSSPLSLALVCPSEGCCGDGVGGHVVDMYQPPPPPCLYNLCQSVHSCSIFQFFV